MQQLKPLQQKNHWPLKIQLLVYLENFSKQSFLILALMKHGAKWFFIHIFFSFLCVLVFRNWRKTQRWKWLIFLMIKNIPNVRTCMTHSQNASFLLSLTLTQTETSNPSLCVNNPNFLPSFGGMNLWWNINDEKKKNLDSPSLWIQLQHHQFSMLNQ